MGAPARLAAFAAALAVVSAGGALAGGAVGPAIKGHDDPEAAHAEPAGGAHGEAGGAAHGAEAAARPVRGLAVAEAGLRLVIDDPELRRGRAETVRFRVVDEDGRTVRDFDVEHEKRMHLIIARRDLATFQHLHPEQAQDSSWSTRVTLDEAGSYRLFADFSHEEEAVTLAGDLRVDGDADLRGLPAPATRAVSDGGLDVRLDVRGEELAFAITRDGRPVEVEPYLGAGGHLVALREGDLAFLHVHPAGDDGAPRFAATFPTRGRYRLFLQFQVDGRVETVAFTHEVR